MDTSDCLDTNILQNISFLFNRRNKLIQVWNSVLRFGTTWGWVNNERIFIFGRTSSIHYVNFPTTLSEQICDPFLGRDPLVLKPFRKYHWCCITVLKQRACVHFSIYGSNSDSLCYSTEDSGISSFSMWKGRLMKANTPVEYNSLSWAFFI